MVESGGCGGSATALAGGGGRGGVGAGGVDDVATEIGEGAADPVNIGGEAGADGVWIAGGAVAIGAAGVYIRVYSKPGGGATAAGGTAATVAGAAVTEDPPPMLGTVAGTPGVPRAVHTTFVVRQRRPVSARSTTAVEAEWLFAPCR